MSKSWPNFVVIHSPRNPRHFWLSTNLLIRLVWYYIHGMTDCAAVNPIARSAMMNHKKVESHPSVKEELLDLLEVALVGALKALRRHRTTGAAPSAAKRAGKKSNTEIVRLILIDSPTPLHISEIIKIAHKKHGVKFNRESIVSALTKKVLDQNTFRRTGRNEFALIDRQY